jgi:hypothetical protein
VIRSRRPQPKLAAAPARRSAQLALGHGSAFCCPRPQAGGFRCISALRFSIHYLVVCERYWTCCFLRFVDVFGGQKIPVHFAERGLRPALQGSTAFCACFLYQITVVGDHAERCASIGKATCGFVCCRRLHPYSAVLLRPMLLRPLQQACCLLINPLGLTGALPGFDQGTL